MSLKQEIKELRNDISDVRNKANVKEQGNAMKALISEVRQFAEAIDAEKQIVSKINQMRRKAQAEPENPEDEQDYEDALAALREAETLKSELSQKKSMLRRVLSDVDELKRYLSKVVN